MREIQDLKPAQFADFFQAVHSADAEPRQPFAWQKRLAKEVLSTGSWRDVIRIPTSCGKTSVLDMAVFEMALQADRAPRERTAPRRICFVVDRRLVVDEAADHAKRILCAVRQASQNPHAAPVLKGVSNRLRTLAPEGGEPLRIVRLRGGVYRDDGWASDPLTPTIIISTVDQIGSRLLFRGYGVSRRNLPVHAGLLAFDTRVIVDEAHLSTVFTETLDRVRCYQRFAKDLPLPEERCLSVVRMSATAPRSKGERSFILSSQERKDPKLRPRLDACKNAELVKVKIAAVTKKMRREQPQKAREQEERNRKELVKKIVCEARRFAGINDERPAEDRPRVVGIVVNRVATARQVHELLKSSDESAEYDAILLTGRIRPFDRDCLLEDWLPRIQAGRRQGPEKSLFVVATQTVEVGANLDFDALVTEASPLDSLRQRFGRLDRLGRRHERDISTPASIVIRSDQARNSEADTVYGGAVAATWKWLQKVASKTGSGATKRETIDFGINRLDENLLQRPPGDIAKLLAQSRECPLLFPAHLDAWVQTNPRPDPDPDVAPFLHGPADTPADVQVVWRADIDSNRVLKWKETVSLMPPLTREALPVPIYAVRAWLDESKGRGGEDVTDIEGKQVVASDAAGRSSGGKRVLRWRGRDDSETEVVVPDAVRPGDTIVVPAKYGGCDRFGWNPLHEEPVDDIANRCLAQRIAPYPSDSFRRPKLRVRLHPDLLPRPDNATHKNLRAMLDKAVMAARVEGGNAWPAVVRLLSAVRLHRTDPYDESAIKALLTCEGRVEPYPDDSGVVVVASVAIDVDGGCLPEGEQVEDEPEGDEASFSRHQVLLAEHLDNVRSTAEAFAKDAGLNEPMVKTLGLAGRWHDEGKRDMRCQAWLHGSELNALAASEPIAKSGRDVSQWKPSTIFGYPRGARHEFLSVRLFDQAEQGSVDGAIIDLAKFIIGTHHGFGRPFPPVVPDKEPIDVTLEHDGREIVVSSDHRLHALDSGWVDLFWRMVRRFGWWGLAYLEALLVTADRTVSAREQSRNTNQMEAAT